MADISSIKLPSGSTYDLKDSVARDKPDFDNFPTNPFSADVNKKLYINKIDNAFYCANKRWTTTVSLYNSSNSLTSTVSGAELFDGNYETTVNVPLGGKAIILMTFDPTFPNYPYGHMFLSFYYNNFPSNVTGRVYSTYQAHGIGWHDITWSKTSYGSLDGNNWTGYNGLYGISQIEITVQGGNTTQTKITQLEMHLDRPHPSRNPFVSKYSAETLYYPLTAPSFIGTVSDVATQGSATNSTARHIWFSDSSTETKRAHSDNFKYTPSTNTITANLSGSATLTGTPTAPTASAGTNNTQIATTAFVKTAIDNAGGGGTNITKAQVTIATADWNLNTCTKTVSGVTASNTVLVGADPSSQEEYFRTSIKAISQSANSITFQCTQPPSESVTVNVLIVDV